MTLSAPSAEVGTASPWTELRRYEQAQADGTAEEFSFSDLLDVINPLQHIPVVSTIYRDLTGDQIGTPARVMGGGLYGGIVGAAGSVANAMLEEASGRDVGEHVMTAMGISEDTPDAAPKVQLAQAAEAGQDAGAPQAAEAPVDAATQPDPMVPDRGTAAEQKAAAADGAGRGAAAEALTGAAALQALAQDLGGGATAAGAVQLSAAAPAAAPAADSQRAAAGVAQRAAAGTPPSEFMPIADQHRMAGYGQRRSLEVLRAAADPVAGPNAPTRAPSAPAPQASAPQASAPAASGTSAAGASPIAPLPGGDSRAHPSQVATPGDFAQRMRMALEKYEAMRRNQ